MNTRPARTSNCCVGESWASGDRSHGAAGRVLRTWRDRGESGGSGVSRAEDVSAGSAWRGQSRRGGQERAARSEGRATANARMNVRRRVRENRERKANRREITRRVTTKIMKRAIAGRRRPTRTRSQASRRSSLRKSAETGEVRGEAQPLGLSLIVPGRSQGQHQKLPPFATPRRGAFVLDAEPAPNRSFQNQARQTARCLL